MTGCDSYFYIPQFIFNISTYLKQLLQIRFNAFLLVRIKFLKPVVFHKQYLKYILFSTNQSIHFGYQNFLKKSLFLKVKIAETKPGFCDDRRLLIHNCWQKHKNIIKCYCKKNWIQKRRFFPKIKQFWKFREKT